jgi:putative SOS response-associated peptidase YedK
MAQIHDREPVVVEPKDFAAWLDGSERLDVQSPWADDGFTYRMVT